MLHVNQRVNENELFENDQLTKPRTDIGTLVVLLKPSVRYIHPWNIQRKHSCNVF